METEEYKFSGEQATKTVHFLAKSKLGWITWKQTESELFWFFERNFGAIRCKLKQTAESDVYGIELELPTTLLPSFEIAFKAESMNVEIDKIHGIDPYYNKVDAKLSRLCITMGSAFIPPAENNSIQSAEKRVTMLENCDRERNLEIKGIMEQMTFTQTELMKKLKMIEEKLDKKLGDMDDRLKTLEKAVGSVKTK